MPSNSRGCDLAKELKATGASQSLAIRINGKLFDLITPLSDGDVVELISFDSEEGKEIFWHTSAHVLAQAVLRLFPEAKNTIGPPIENGFYFDFANLTLTESDLERIEKEMEAIIRENYPIKREILADKEAAKKVFHKNPYKLELIEGFEEGGISVYHQGEYCDPCRGPHLPSLSKIKAVKVIKTAGAYWRGDPSREMLTRIYGITFPDKALLKGYLDHIEEAKRRDHKVLGPKLELFCLYEDLAPGIPFFLPKGMILWHEIMRYWHECHNKAGYVEIRTPLIMIRELWERSGHWQNYREHMYTLTIEERDFALKPMNCPGGILCYKSTIHSYREFPMRVAEIGHVHRYESHGALSGLVRVRGFHQDDAHIYLEMEQVEEEIVALLKMTAEMYTTFGLTFELSLSTKPASGTIGSDEVWEKATAALKGALIRHGQPFKINEGDGAFYGPKIDTHIKDALGRRWQTATTQIDMNLPERFDLTYDAKDGTKKRPIMLHRTIYGGIERFVGILIEHFAGKFPLWMSPRQIRLIPVADRHIAYARELKEKLVAMNFHVEVDESAESVGKKIREAQLMQVNYMLTLGDREVESSTVSVRTRDNQVHGEIAFETFVNTIQKERSERSLSSPFSKV